MATWEYMVKDYALQSVGHYLFNIQKTKPSGGGSLN